MRNTTNNHLNSALRAAFGRLAHSTVRSPEELATEATYTAGLRTLTAEECARMDALEAGSIHVRVALRRMRPMGATAASKLAPADLALLQRMGLAPLGWYAQREECVLCYSSRCEGDC